MLDAYLEIIELDFYEVKEAFGGLADENVWKRPAEGLLSVGELAGHMAYWLAVRLAGEGKGGGEAGGQTPDLAKCPVSSPLIDHRFDYYPRTLATPPSEQHRAMTAEQVLNELQRVHAESVAHFKALNPNLESDSTEWPGWTYASLVKYQAFHVAYHTGQIYTARHLLGEQTPDN